MLAGAIPALIDPIHLQLHWDGTRWSVIPSPNVPVNYNVLTGVTAIATNAVWAVGYSTTVVWEGEYEVFYDTTLAMQRMSPEITPNNSA